MPYKRQVLDHTVYTAHLSFVLNMVLCATLDPRRMQVVEKPMLGKRIFLHARDNRDLTCDLIRYISGSAIAVFSAGSVFVTSRDVRVH